MDAAYAAGFRSERALLTVTSIAVAESSLRANARNWHPEYGFRPVRDVLGVRGSGRVRSRSDDGRQLHSDRGIWQISSRWWPIYTDAQCDDPDLAARIVFVISDRGRDFTSWDTYRNGAAVAYDDRAVGGWPALRPLVRSYLIEHA